MIPDKLTSGWLGLLLSFVFLRESQAWMSAPSNHLNRHSILPSFSKTATTTQLSLFNNNNNKETQSKSSSSSSRREWLQNIFAAAAAAAAGTAATSTIICRPSASWAADIPSSAKSICDPAVSIWKKDDRLVYLLGTAHISESSAELAGKLVQEIHPKGVFVELDPKRVRGSGILAKRVDLESEGGGDDAADATPTSRVIVPNIQTPSQFIATADSTASGGGGGGGTESTPSPKKSGPLMRAASAAVGNSIRGMYKKLDSSGFKAGEEFTIAIQEGQKIGSDIVLGDRDVEVTLTRLAEGLAKTDLNMLLNPDSELEQSLKELMPASSAADMANKSEADLTDEEFRKEFSTFVEVVKTKENVRKIMAQLQRTAPALYEALVSERDAYMAAGLNGLNELETIVAVMGIAHVNGVEANLKMNGWRDVTPACALGK